MYTKEKYEHLLDLLLKEGYRFSNFAEHDLNGSPDKIVYLRHDIDYSLDMAVTFAEINHRWNVKATFCLQLRSGIYNLLSYEAMEKVRQIHQFGQYLGMHFAFPPNLPEEKILAQKVLKDFSIMKEHIPEMRPVFGWHNPGTYPGYHAGLAETLWGLAVPGLVNIYSNQFIKEMPYFSDSNLRYSVDEFEKIFRQGHPRMHLLFHPFQWMSEGKDMLKVLAITWKTIIREREEGIVNAVYGKRFPQGIPEEYLDQLAQRIMG